MATHKRKPTSELSPARDTGVLDNHLRALKLPTVLAEYANVGQRCSQANATYDVYLEDLTRLELARRDSNSQLRRIQAAKLPVVKELADFKFASIPGLNKAKVVELSGCEYIASRTNVVMVGPPGVGKTHIAIALALCACRNGYNARFFTAAEVVNTYREARDTKTIQRLEANVKRFDMIVIDELGYLPIDRIGAEHLFGFFSLCYEQVSLVVTTNLPFTQWPHTFAGDERLTGALLDRLTHRIEVLSISGDSYRLQQSRNEKLKRSVESKKTSGS